MPVVYSLTQLTGRRRDENRRMVVATFEVRRHTFLVSLAGAAISLPITGILSLIFGLYALITPVVVIGLCLWLWDVRQTRGLKLRNYQAILDTRRARNGVLYAAGRPVPKPVLVMHQRQFLPAPPPQTADIAGTRSNPDNRHRRHPRPTHR